MGLVTATGCASMDEIAMAEKITLARPTRPREVTIGAKAQSLSTMVHYGPLEWSLSADDADAPDPVTSFLGALGSCLLMSLRVAASARNLNLGQTSLIARANEKGHIKEIEIELKIQTDIGDDQLRRLVEVAERGCHIRAMIRDEVGYALRVAKI